MEQPKLTSYCFIGSHKPFYSIAGDVWIEGDNVYVFDGREDFLLSETKSSLLEAPFTNPIKELPTHCPCCGAPVNSYRSKCEYCGVEYRKISYKS